MFGSPMKDGERRWVRVAATGKSIGKSGCHRNGAPDSRYIGQRSAGPPPGDNRRARYRDISHAGLSPVAFVRGRM